MAARDKYHYEFREALEKDGWIITNDPYNLKVDSKRTYPIDIGAEKLIAAQRDNDKIAVEIKSFLQDSLASAFHEASGQYLGYFLGLKIQEPDRTLFIAVPEEEYVQLEQMVLVQMVSEHLKMQFVIFDPTLKIITRWIK
jgi:XisH protein